MPPRAAGSGKRRALAAEGDGEGASAKRARPGGDDGGAAARAAAREGRGATLRALPREALLLPDAEGVTQCLNIPW